MKIKGKFTLMPEKTEVIIPETFDSIEEIDTFFIQSHNDFLYSDMDRLSKGPLHNIKDKEVEKHLSIKIAAERKFLIEKEKNEPLLVVRKIKKGSALSKKEKSERHARRREKIERLLKPSNPLEVLKRIGLEDHYPYHMFVSTPMGGQNRYHR